MMAKKLLEVNDVYKSFGAKTAVSGVGFSLAQGEILCLLGPSGCGKTTLLRLIAGLEQTDSGEIWYAGQNVTRIPPHRRGFGMMFQDYALFPHKNVQDNIAFGLEMRGDSREQIALRVEEMLALVELDGFGEREIDRLSGGEQQRVALARALAPDPKLLLLDEPLGALDRALRERLMVDLRLILKRLAVTAVYVTHDQTEALAIGDVVAVMNNGRIEQLAPPQTLFNKPNSPFVARFLGFENVINGRLTSNGRVETPIGSFTLGHSSDSQAGDVSLLVKPEAAEFFPANGKPLKENDVLVEVVQVGFYGRYFQLTVHPISKDGQLLSTPLEFELKKADYERFQRLVMRLDSAEIHLFET